MKTHIVRVSNSRGVRLPKVLLHVERGRIVIGKLRLPRAGWAEAAKQMYERRDDELFDALTPTRFDDEEWKWR